MRRTFWTIWSQASSANVIILVNHLQRGIGHDDQEVNMRHCAKVGIKESKYISV